MTNLSDQMAWREPGGQQIWKGSCVFIMYENGDEKPGGVMKTKQNKEKQIKTNSDQLFCPDGLVEARGATNLQG